MSLEFEHFMGTNPIPQGALFHPDGQKYVFTSGACVIIGDLLDPHQQEFLRYHSDRVTCLALSTSGRYLASGQVGEAADVYLYDSVAKQVLYRFEEHDHGLEAVAFSEDEKMLASLGVPEDNNLILWDMSNGCIIASTNKLPAQTKCVSFMGFVKDIKRRDTNHYQLCSAGADGLVLWDLDPYSGDLIPQKVMGDARATISRHITAIRATADYEHIYAATSSGDYIVCNVKSLRIIASINATKMSLYSLVMHQGKLFIGCGDKSIKIYSLQGDFIQQIAMDGAVLGLCLSPDKLELLAITSFGSICRVNLATSQSLILSEAHTNHVLKVAFDLGSDSDRIATISLDHSIKVGDFVQYHKPLIVTVWDLSDYAVISTAYARRESEPGAQPWSLAFNNLLFSGWSDGKILAHSAETGESLWMLDNAHQGGVSALVLSHNRRFLLSGAPSGDLRLWELRTRELISHLKEHKQRVHALKLRQDDTIAISGSRDRCILTWDLRSEKRVMCHMQRMGGINDFVLSRCENFIISVGQDRKIVIWHIQQSDQVYAQPLDGENDEGLTIDM
eukprot:scaffold11736_cov159-Ochromonas_danica.AAC.1